MIVLWFGAIVDVPPGWQYCDGTNGTPNLKDRFPVGAGDSYAVNATGGILDHDHTFTAGGHNHIQAAGTDISEGSDLRDLNSLENLTGTTSEIEIAAPFYTLAYIQAMV